MGAGAGCDIFIKDCQVAEVEDINLQDATLEVDRWNATITLGCRVKMDGTVKVSSYYASTGDIEEVALTVTKVSLGLDLGSGNDASVLTPEAVNRFESQFGDDINSIWEQYLPILTVNDIDPEYLKRERAYGVNYDGTGKFGGGWTRSAFTGQVEITDVDSHSGYNSISGYTGSIDEEFVIDYIDKARYGDNEVYFAYYDDADIGDTYDTLDEAVAALKEMILDNLTAADPYSCYVEKTYYYLVNGSVDNYEYEYDYDYVTREYTAASDPEFDFESLAEAAEELDEESDVGLPEDYDI